LQQRTLADPFKQILRTIDYVARHCSADHPDPAAYRRDPDLAVQLRLGYYPSGGVGLILIIVLILVLLGRI